MKHDGRARVVLGCQAGTMSTNFSGYACNTTSIFFGHTFWMREAKNVTEISVYQYSKTGSPTYGNYEMHLQEINLTTNLPSGTDIATTTVTSTGAYQASQGFNVFQFSSPVALEANKKYIWFIKCLVSDASNYLSMGTASMTEPHSGQMYYGAEARMYTTNGGSTWTVAAYMPSWRVTFDDGTSSGIPIYSYFTNSIGGNNWGTTYTTPAGLRMKLSCVCIGASRSGTYTGTWVMQIRASRAPSTVIATSLNSYTQGQFSTTGGSLTPFLFDNVILEPNTKYIFTMYCNSGTAQGVGAQAGSLEDFGAYVRDLKAQIGGDVVHDLTSEYTEDVYRRYVVKLSLIGEYENPFYAKSSIS